MISYRSRVHKRAVIHRNWEFGKPATRYSFESDELSQIVADLSGFQGIEITISGSCDRTSYHFVSCMKQRRGSEK